MRIDSGNIGMESARTYSRKEVRVRQYSASVNTGKAFDNDLFGSLGVSVSKVLTPSVSAEERLQRLREEYINLILRLLFPEKEFDLENRDIGIKGIDMTENRGSAYVSIGYRYEYFFEETEEVSYNAKGIVNCKDGRQIEINLDIEMSRSFSEYYAEEVDFLETSLTDPLVIDYDGSSAALSGLSDQKFRFDLDCDGVEDEINRLVEGSGFLALDEDEDGIINDGSELFGTRSGDGFKDLASYDTDKDGFIDEDDAVFDKLRIMCIDENGRQQLYSLKEKEIGAIYLGKSATKFSLNDAENRTEGVVRSTGVFLYEDGTAGSIRQLDMAKGNKAAVTKAIASYDI